MIHQDASASECFACVSSCPRSRHRIQDEIALVGGHFYNALQEFHGFGCWIPTFFGTLCNRRNVVPQIHTRLAFGLVEIDFFVQIRTRSGWDIQSVLVCERLQIGLRNAPSSLGCKCASANREGIQMSGSSSVRNKMSQCEIASVIFVLKGVLDIVLVAGLIDQIELAFFSLKAPEENVDGGSQGFLHVVFGATAFPDNGSHVFESLPKNLLWQKHLIGRDMKEEIPSWAENPNAFVHHLHKKGTVVCVCPLVVESYFRSVLQSIQPIAVEGGIQIHSLHRFRSHSLQKGSAIAMLNVHGRDVYVLARIRFWLGNFAPRGHLHGSAVIHPMSGTVDAAGWYISTNRELENASLPSVISEDIHNVEHYYEAHGADAQMARIVYVSGSFGGKVLFVRASNMPHTEAIITKKFTAFAQKSFESMVATHGYGALLPSMYIGGALEIQFKEDNEWKRITLDIEAQRKECLEHRRLTILPSNACEIDLGGCPLVENPTIWNDQIRQEFNAQGICTIELHKNPTFKERCDIRDETTFCHFLESAQGQFEEILNKKVAITGIFLSENKTSTIYKLPYNFFKKLYNPLAAEYPFPYSPYGATQLELCRSFEIDYSDTHIRCQTKIRGNPVLFTLTEKGDIVHETNPNPVFTPRFRVWIGRAQKDTHEYARHITTHPEHPLYLQTMEAYADGLVVNLDGYRMTLLPIRGEIVVARSLPFASRTRMGIDVYDQTTKQKFIDAKPHKDASTLKTIHTGVGNVLKFVTKRLAALVSRCNDPAETDGNEDDRLYRAIAVEPAARKVSVRRAAVRGHSFENNCAELLRLEFADRDYQIVEGDVKIRRDFLQSDNKQYTGIDILVQVPELMNIVIQCKDKDRLQPEDYESFLRTFKYARDLHKSIPIHGLFVVDKDKLTWNKGLRELVSTPGVTLVFSNVNEAVQKTIDHYAE